MPKAVQEAYETLKLCSWPDSDHSYDLARFYKFIAALLETREKRDLSWLRDLLTQDCPRWPKEQIADLVNRYEIILDYQMAVKNM